MTIALIDRYRTRLPVSATTPVISLGEGSTPLLAAPRLSERLGVELWLKWEASNPTGSYKDRGMTVAVSRAAEDGAEAVICASTGNTAASAAAYAARAGLPAVVLTPAGAVAGPKVAQTRMLGAKVLEVRGDFDHALAAAQELAGRGTHVLVNSINPNRRAGQKTAVFEIVEELGGAPDAFVIPYGGGGNTSAYAAGISELGLSTPIFSVEAQHRPTTMASAIRIGDPVHAASVRDSGADGRHRLRRRDRRRLARARLARGPLLRAVLGRRAGRDQARRRARRQARRHDHRARPQGQRERRPVRTGTRAGRRRSGRDRRGRPVMKLRAPATSANIGAGFDTAAVALDLWNDLEVTDGSGVVVEGEGASELAADETNLAVRAYALLADPSGKRFSFLNRIPLERGLGSSAAAIALGLVAAAPERERRGAARGRPHAGAPRRQPRGGAARGAHAVVGREDRADRRAAAARADRGDPERPDVDGGLPPDAADHRAACRGGRKRRARRAPRRRARRPGDAELFAAALNDWLHEPYRPSSVLDEVRNSLPAGCAGATLSGSGPTVIAWASDARCTATELRERFPDHTVLWLDVAPRGAL